MLDRATALHRRMAERSPARTPSRGWRWALVSADHGQGVLENGKVDFLSRADFGGPRFCKSPSRETAW